MVQRMDMPNKHTTDRAEHWMYVLLTHDEPRHQGQEPRLALQHKLPSRPTGFCNGW